MTFRLLLSLILAATILEVRSQTDDSRKGSTFSVSVNLIKVPVSVFDEKGVMVDSLRREDFRVYENGIEQEIRNFGVDRNPISVVLAIDTSGSSEKEEKELKKIKEAAEGFIMALSPEDQVSIIAFSDQVELAQNWTSDKKLARKAVRKLEPGLRTALYDAMYAAAHDQVKNIEGRKAIVLLTDGLNNQSSLNFREASLSVIQSQAALYVISKSVIIREAAKRQRRVVMLSEIYNRHFGDADYVEDFFRKREAEISDLSEKTGGRALFPSSYDEIKDVYAEFARELKSKHYLTYVSNREKASNSYNNIALEYLPSFSKIIYRKGYYFEPAPIHKRRLSSGRR
jgi:Ca-activated chloride channel homolog